MKTDGWTQHDDSDHLGQSQYNAMNHTLDIEFKNGAVHRYHGVPPRENEAFLSAPSQGVYFHQNIRNNYVSKRIK